MEKTENPGFGRVLLESICLMAALQALRELLMRILTAALPDGMFAKKMATMCILALFALLVIGLAKYRKQELSVFPAKFTRFYMIATAVVLALYITAPMNYIGGFPAVMELFYGSVVTPVFEELLFRGYIWNRMRRSCRKKAMCISGTWRYLRCGMSAI